MEHRPSLERIAQASTTVDPVFLHTPQFVGDQGLAHASGGRKPGSTVLIDALSWGWAATSRPSRSTE